MDDLEKFLMGQPLNEQLAALQRGEDEAEPLSCPAPRTQAAGAMDDGDREHLRRLRTEPGWPLFLRLLDRDIQSQEESIRNMSMQDPLGNRDKVAEGWAYIAMMKRVRVRAVMLVDAEVEKLEKTAQAGGQRA
jgi:hypothetical protein